MKASRRSRGAREMRKEREKREAEKNKKKKEKKKRGLLARSPLRSGRRKADVPPDVVRPGSLAGCTRVRNYVSRLACGFEKRQQDGGGGVGDGGGEEVGVKDWKWKNGRMVEIAGRMLAIKKRKKKVEMMGLDVEVGDV